LLVSLCIAGCSRGHTSDIAGYLKWLNDPGNGLTQARTINGLRLAVKYLPPDYRAYQELQGVGSAANRAEVEKRCAGSVAFLLSVSPDTSISPAGAPDPRAVAMQGMMLDQEVKERLIVRAGGRDYTPVLTALDNNAGMEGTIGITAIYVDETLGGLPDAPAYDVSLDDELLGTGITHFLFDRKAIDARVRLDF
jgi:hypothetical protein